MSGTDGGASRQAVYGKICMSACVCHLCTQLRVDSIGHDTRLPILVS